MIDFQNGSKYMYSSVIEIIVSQATESNLNDNK